MADSKKTSSLKSSLNDDSSEHADSSEPNRLLPVPAQIQSEESGDTSAVPLQSSESPPNKSYLSKITDEYLRQKSDSDQLLSSYAALPAEQKKLMQVVKEAEERAKAILRNWNYLRQLLEEVQDEAIQFWLSINENQKAQILRQIMPKISRLRRPDLLTVNWISTMDPKDIESTDKIRAAFLWPQLNLAELTEDPKLLIDLLLNRSRHYPHEFARTDYRNLQPASSTSIIFQDLKYVDSQFLMLLDPESYGRIVTRSESEDCKGYKNTKAWFGRGVRVSRGLCMMEAQQGILEFLIGYCRIIVLGIEQHGQIQTFGWNIEPNVQRQWPEIGMKRISSRFHGAPETPSNFGRLSAMLRARRELAEDHIWLLRVNPGYYNESLEAFSKDLDGWNVSGLIVDALVSEAMWEWLSLKACQVPVREEMYGSFPSREEKLPQHYIMTLATLERGMQYHSEYFLAQLRGSAEYSEESDCLWSYVKEHWKKEGDEAAIMELLIIKIWSESNNMMLYDFMDEMERDVIQKAPGGHKISHIGKKMSALYASKLSDIGLLGLIEYELRKFEPWINQTTTIEHQNLIAVFRNVSEHKADLESLRDTHEVVKAQLYELGNPEGNRFQYPVVNRHLKENAESRLSAERDLAELWKYVDKKIRNSPILQPMPKKIVSIDNLDARVPKFTLAEEVPYVMKVSRRAMNVFLIIFQGTPLVTSSPVVKIHFKEFVNAMEEVGFRARKHHISLWHFDPEGVPTWADPRLAHGIMIHEPWPNQRISAKYAYQLGQRLHRRYGWHIDMFTVKVNPNTHWLARFDGAELMEGGGETMGGEESSLSTAEVVKRNKQIEKLQADAKVEQVAEARAKAGTGAKPWRSNLFNGNIEFCAETNHQSFESGQRREYPILFGDWSKQ